MDTHRPEVQSPKAALGPLPSLPSKDFQGPTQSIPPLSELSLTSSSALIPRLHLVFKGVTQPSQECSYSDKEPKPLTAPSCKAHHAMRPQNLVSTQASVHSQQQLLLSIPRPPLAPMVGVGGGGRDRGNPENGEADGVALGNTGRAHALSTGQLLLSPGHRGHGKVHLQSDFSREAEN